MSVDTILDVQATRSIKRGTLEDSNFKSNRIFNIGEVLPVLKSLDPVTQKAVFPDPRWFLEKNYFLTRVGVADDVTGKRYVAAHWDTKKNISEARAASEEEVAWQQLSGSPVWPGGKPD